MNIQCTYADTPHTANYFLSYEEGLQNLFRGTEFLIELNCVKMYINDVVCKKRKWEITST